MSCTEAQIAQVCHDANRALQQIHLADGDRSIPVAMPWWQLPEPDRLRVIAGVRAALRGASPEDLHTEWHDALRAEGWTWGPRKDTTRRIHPCLKPYDQLPPEQQRKDRLFHAIVAALATDAVEVTGEAGWYERGGSMEVDPAAVTEAMVVPHRMAPAPYIGAQVHYVAHGTPIREDGSQAFPMACRAAIITEINSGGNVGLFVVNPTGTFLHPADYDPGLFLDREPMCDGKAHGGGTWHWPA